MRNTQIFWLLGLIIFVIKMIPCAVAQYVSPVNLNDAAGNWGQSSEYHGFATIGQSSAIRTTTNSSYQSLNGFLQTFVMFPQRDSNGNGIPNENDPDDDGDGISDAMELNGSAFSPQTPTSILESDTDNDGLTDEEERICGTDPTNESEALRVEIELENERTVISWGGREGKIYDVLFATSITQMLENPLVVETLTAGDGTGVWMKTQCMHTNNQTAASVLYRILVKGDDI